MHPVQIATGYTGMEFKAKVNYFSEVFVTFLFMYQWYFVILLLDHVKMINHMSSLV